MFQKPVDLLSTATHVVVFTGAGMSAPLGTPTYWAGENARYADDKSVFGLTALQHATEKYWWKNREAQLDYYKTVFETYDSLHSEPNHYHTLLGWLNREGKQYFNVTSNIDNAFVNTGFDAGKLFEIHGASRYSQCLICSDTHGVFPTVKGVRMVCPECGNDARPNVLFFDDVEFNDTVNTAQYGRYRQFIETVPVDSTVVLDVGSGVTVDTIRRTALRLHAYKQLPLIRINPEPYPTVRSYHEERAVRKGTSDHVPLENLVVDVVDAFNRLFS